MNPTMDRRYFGFGAFALIGCARSPKAQSEHHVSISKCSNYSGDLEGMILRVIKEHRIPVQGLRIVLKPNLVEFDSGSVINTNPQFVSAVYNTFLSLGAKDVSIAEGPGHRRATMDLANAAGYFQSVAKFEDKFVDLNLDDHRFIPIHQPFSKLNGLHLPETILNCDLLVSLPKMKTHHWAGATLSMKNLFGIVPGAIYGWPKNILHWAGIPESIADLHLLFPRQFAIVDGIEAMEGNGPILGSLKKAGVVVAGAHPPSVDATCCRIMGIDPEKIAYLQLVAERTGWNEKQTRQIGVEVSEVHTHFSLIPDLQYLHLQQGA